MENRFLEAEDHLKRVSRRRRCAPKSRNGRSLVEKQNGVKSYESSLWSRPFAATDRTLVILIENGGVDLGIPELANKLLERLPDVIPDGVKDKLVARIRERLTNFTDNLIETLELTINRYNAAKPDFYGDVVTLRDSTSSYNDLKNKLLDLSRSGRIIDLFVLTHGRGDYISVPGGVNSDKIRAMKSELGSPLTIRSVYMMNCVGSSLNQAWIDAGAKVSSGAKRNNYLPEPTMFFFWKNWKAGQTFESAVTSAYRQTINVMNEAVRNFISSLPIPGAGLLASRFNIEDFDLVEASAPVIQGQRSVTVTTDNLSFTQTMSSSLATTVLPLSVLQSLVLSHATSNGDKKTVSPAGVDFIKGWEGFVAKPYNDPVGHCTVGYGTLLHNGNCDGRPIEAPYANGISQEKATQLLAEKAAEFQLVIDSNVKVSLNQNQYDALVSFAYNVGGANFQKSTLLRLLNNGDYNAVPMELKKWTKAHQNGKLIDLPGLVRRRAAEAELFQKPVTAATAQSMSAALSTDWYRSLSTIDYTIPPLLPVIAQPSGLTCWAAVVTMMWSWKNNQSMAIPDVLAQIGSQWVDRFKAGKSLAKNIAKDLYDAAGLVQLISFNPTIEGWLELLQKYGPLYVDVGYNTGTGTHAIIVIAIKGDGTAAGTTITYVDPDGGKTVPMNFSDFLVKYEAKSAVEWPYTIVHWPAGARVSSQQSFPIRHRYAFDRASDVVTSQSLYSWQQNPAAAVVAGIEIADAAQIGLGAISVVQAQVAASQGSFSLTYDKVSRLLTNEARQAMPGAKTAKKSYSCNLLFLAIGRLFTAEADVIVEWEGNAYGEIGTPVFRRNLPTSTDWSKSAANLTISKIDRIPLPQTDPRTWPIVYTYEGTYDPLGNGYFEFTGEFQLNAFGGLKFTRHEVVSRSAADWALGGTPEGKVQRGSDVVVPTPTIPQDQLDYLKTKLP
ncbi:MAG TPA: papain-like cysteine protease family protein [Pyrinomonadaceae bacterium]|jgi:GH24 family phage-related lysozyme (muramidase)